MSAEIIIRRAKPSENDFRVRALVQTIADETFCLPLREFSGADRGGQLAPRLAGSLRRRDCGRDHDAGGVGEQFVGSLRQPQEWHRREVTSTCRT